MSEYIKVYFLLLSGGMDSTVAGLKIIERNDCERIVPVFVNYGQKSVQQEWDSVKKVAESMKALSSGGEITFESPVRIDLKNKRGFGIFDWSESQLITGSSETSACLENRNMVLISIVASYAESMITENEEAVIVTGFRHEWEDTSPEFVDAINSVFEILNNKVRVEAPVIRFKDKKKMVKENEKYKKFFDLTWSCYMPVNGKPCGTCDACTLRQEALETLIRKKSA